jgi:proton-dependent oligopeptide transporter, POT family
MIEGRRGSHHPPGLYVLFFSEAFERFSFYGLQALLVLYLTRGLLFSREDALGVYAIYMGLVYVLSLVGGWFADNVLGARKAILVGGVLMAAGQAALMFPALLSFGLGLVVVGTGFFKPNISTIVSGLYQERDPRRDAAFTIFYMGINLGAMTAPLACGYLGEKIDWPFGFGAASAGVCLGVLGFLAGQRFLGTAGFPPGRLVDERTRLSAQDFLQVALFIVGIVVVIATALGLWRVVGPIWTPLPWELKLAVFLAGLAAVFGAIQLRSRRKASVGGPVATPFTADEWKRIAVILIIVGFVVFFWTGFFQAGGTMTLFADQQTDRHLPLPGRPEWELPASWFATINPFFIVTLAPLLSFLWTRLDKTRYALSTSVKMGLGMIVLGFGFVLMYFGQGVAQSQGLAPVYWLIAVYFFNSIGELCLSPIGLSMVTNLAPPRIVSLMMGAWFAAMGTAGYLAGSLESILQRWNLPLWQFLFSTSIGAGVVLIAISPLLRRWSQGRA